MSGHSKRGDSQSRGKRGPELRDAFPPGRKQHAQPARPLQDATRIANRGFRPPSRLIPTEQAIDLSYGNEAKELASQRFDLTISDQCLQLDAANSQARRRLVQREHHLRLEI